ncbi:MAG: cation:proton antiporter [Bacteroidales bacterium]|nr:cation:proton antiporter [Bacteroidales bacterium]
METGINFVNDLAIILITAGLCTIICRALKQPLILGYIIAGFIISPNLGIFGISSQEAVEQWSDIGIIFLMFGLGLEFSFKKLIAAGSQAIVTALSKFLGVFVIGFLIGQALGWTSMESIFLAGLLSMSSTVVVIKTYEDFGLKKEPYAGIVFGTLVVEDMIAILLMVLLSTLAVSNNFSGGEMLLNLGKLVFFLVLWFVVGIYVIPTLLKKTSRFLSDEILLVISLGLCFGMVSLATASGFSSALGAFMMGSILAETIENEKILKLIAPIKDLFGAIFFVSVGMMIAPAQIAAHWWVILILALTVVVTHILFVIVGIILAGGNLKNAVHSGFSLAQLGEFGFIIAGVGVSLGVMRDFIYPVIIAVSVLTIFTTPYTVKLAGPVYKLLQRILKPSLLARIDKPDSLADRSKAEKSEWKKVITAFVIRVLVYGVLLSAIMILSGSYLGKIVTRLLPDISTPLHNTICILTTLAVMAPFLYGLVSRNHKSQLSIGKLLAEKRSNSWPLMGLDISRIFLAMGFVLAAISHYAKLSGWVVIVLLFAGFVMLVITRNFLRRYQTLETRFLRNLNEKEETVRKLRPVTASVKQSLGSYDVHIEEMEISPESSWAGQRLKNLPLRESSGANIIKIARGSKRYTIPDGDTVVYPGDKLYAVGTGEQLEAMRTLLQSSNKEYVCEGDDYFKVEPVTLTEGSYMTGQSLRSLNLRSYGCMIISMLRDDKFVTNPKPDTVFHAGDTVWLAGDVDSLTWLEK